jgi:phenylalanyl-tRNA synthetase alpha chain
LVRPLNLDDAAVKLHEHERRVLLALEGRETATTQELSIETSLGRDAVEKASAWAETKGVVTFREEVSKRFNLTEEGRKYAREGLPEKNLVNLVAEGINDIANLKSKLETLSIALIWVRRNGWANINDGKILLSSEGLQVKNKKLADEQLLESLVDGSLDKSIDEETQARLEKLEKRNLVDVTVSRQRWVELTDEGKNLLPVIKKIQTTPIITQITPKILKNNSWKNTRFQGYDITLPVPSLYPGKRHFLSSIIDYIRRFWVELGFKEMTGEYLELNFWNFDALFQPQDHPARDLADTFYLKTPEKGHLPTADMVENVKQTHENGWTTGSTGWQYTWDPEISARNCLRTHTTSLSVNQIAKLSPDELPGKFFSVGRVFRNETIDWNHLAEFYQTDGIVIGEGVTFKNMQGYLKAYLEGLGLKRFRFRPGYFPYTEMSMEAEVWIEERGEWMELFGAGMFRPEVVKPLIGIDVPVLAWGPGFDRLIMQSYGIDSIRQLYGNDLGLLRSARLWME